MPIAVQHGPSMVDYGMAVAKAAEKQAAATRAQSYGSYLAGLQGAQQEYGLGLGNLGVAQSRTEIERQRIQRSQDLEEFRNNLAAQQLQLAARTQGTQSTADLLRAYAAQDQGYASLLGGLSRYGYF